jgi:hypothetical protein
MAKEEKQICGIAEAPFLKFPPLWIAEDFCLVLERSGAGDLMCPLRNAMLEGDFKNNTGGRAMKTQNKEKQNRLKHFQWHGLSMLFHFSWKLYFYKTPSKKLISFPGRKCERR